MRPSKKEVLWTCYLPSRVARKFSKYFSHLTCVFADLLRVTAIRRNNREHHTMLQTDIMIPNVSRCQFFSFHTPFKPSQYREHIGTFKKRDFVDVLPTFLVAIKFSKAFSHPTCVFADLLRVIAIRRNKREHHTMLQTYIMIPNVSRCQFFSFHTPFKPSQYMEHFETFKKRDFLDVLPTFESCKKFF